MIPELEKALGMFRERITYARIFLNDRRTLIEIKFDPYYMEIRNLEELPAYVRIRLNEQYSSNKNLSLNDAEYSNDAIMWKAFDKEITNYLQIYRLLDPVFILPKTKFENEGRISRNLDLFTMTGFYDISELPLSDSVKKIFEEERKTVNRIRVSMVGTEILRLVQDDIPPFRDTISLFFERMTLVA